MAAKLWFRASSQGGRSAQPALRCILKTKGHEYRVIGTTAGYLAGNAGDRHGVRIEILP